MLVKVNESDATRRTLTFFLVGTDFTTPATGEDGGQPQIRFVGGTWTDTGIGTLIARGNGSYDAVLTIDALSAAGTKILGRYKSAGTAECPAEQIVEVVNYDPVEGTGIVESTEVVNEYASDAP